MTNDEGSSNDRMSKLALLDAMPDSDFVIPSSLGIRASSLESGWAIAADMTNHQ
jgi:hypothetical protein